MVIVHNTDKYKYFDKQRKVELIRYSNGVKKIYEGQAIYLPRRIYEGQNVFSDIVNFISKNKDTIGNIASTASSVVDTIGKVGNTILDLVRKARELKNKQPITDEAINKVLNASKVKGSGFFYVWAQFWII